MRFTGISNGYDRVCDEETEGNAGSNQETSASIPINPPEYDSSLINNEANLSNSNNRAMEQMDLEDAPQENNSDERLFDKMFHFRDRISNNIVAPVRERIVDPLVQVTYIISEKIDYYLNKVGNPLILRRFFYVFLMSTIAYLVMSSGLMPTERSTGTKGMFSDFDILLDYTKAEVDLSKLETDLQYLSSMPHMSGTQGDWAIRNYVAESFSNNKLKFVKETEFTAYSNYYNEASLKAVKNGGETIFELTESNFNPSCTNGELKNMNLIYGNTGSMEDLHILKELGMLDEDFILLVHYGKVVSEQILLAEKFDAKGILFITEPYGDDKDVVQKKSVAIHQYWTGDALTPGWYGGVLPEIKPQESKSLPRIPSLPLSWNQGSKLLSLLGDTGFKWKENEYSGEPGEKSVRIDMKVNAATRKKHPVHNVIGKIEGREQNDKAIIIAASRTNGINGATYPAFGTAVLLSLIQSFQELKYKFGWKPLRNIYFISFGGSEFNYAGATELLEQQLITIKNEVYSVLDISQLGLVSSDKKLDVQSHPLLHNFFGNRQDSFGFDVSVRNVEQYGDWTPFMASGIPVSVLSTPEILDSKPPIDTSKDVFEKFKKLLESPDVRQKTSDLILYIFKSSLKLADSPLLPFDITDYLQNLADQFRSLAGKFGNELNFVGAQKALLSWRAIGLEWSAWSDGWRNIVYNRDEGLEPSLLSVHRWTWNKKLSNIVRRQCSATGVPQRQFYKNIIFGPTLWAQDTVPESWVFPGVRDATSNGDWNAAQQELDAVIRMLEESAALFMEETTDVGN
ncbi:hypothetical protein HG535_0A06360 [Zygotorulaspora mrakii]|uniref:Transferrin receptor-like dimerisation domain-containing protein n=1 Tax=Zygotorulaspora mrakii TaxID=42260 RepID=A0A7H9AX86_ZYGMR|nr:uncharacterized protein HG535_0A06360 [Zygotorulaspora mrakii]QLG70694.1 hypothetical protein HG535_0A06360 [Zygotorulaspora mrakii]